MKRPEWYTREIEKQAKEIEETELKVVAGPTPEGVIILANKETDNLELWKETGHYKGFTVTVNEVSYRFNHIINPEAEDV